MARAKRTARAEARRRYRADHPQAASEFETDDPEGEEGGEASGATPARRASAAKSSGSGADSPRPPARMGALGAFRAAYQPADIRGDIRALPELIRSRATWVTALLVVISTVIFIAASSAAVDASSIGALTPTASASASVSAAPTTSPVTSATASAGASAAPSPSGSTDTTGSGTANPLLVTIASILALLFLQAPPIGGIYLSAILAKRSSYLAGGIAGLLGAIGFAIYVLAFKLPAGVEPPPNFDDYKTQLIEQSLFTSTIFGILIGAGLGYYRRLLRLMNPTPNRPANRSRQPARRR